MTVNDTRPNFRNLLPPSLRRRRILIRGLRRWGAIGALTVLGLAAFAGWHARRHVVAVAELEELRSSTGPLQACRCKTTRHRTRHDEVLAQLRERERLVPTENTLELLDLVARGWRAGGGEMSIESIEISRNRVALPDNGGETETTRVELGGIAVDDFVLSKFVAGLRREVAAGRVELQSAVNETVEDHDVRRYVVVCSFE